MAILKRAPWSAIAVGLLPMLSGCFFDQMQRSEETDIQRVEQKQATLQAQQEKAATLKQQEEQLATELSERQLSLSELNERVQGILAANERTLADNEAKHFQYDDLLGQVHETNQQLARLQQDTPGPMEERRERIAYLQTRLKAELDRLLH